MLTSVWLSIFNDFISRHQSEDMFISTGPLYWDEAENYCVNVHGSHLLSINSTETMELAEALCETADHSIFYASGCWIGLVC